MRFTILFFIAFLSANSYLAGQDTPIIVDTTATDSLYPRIADAETTVVKSKKTKKYPNPKKALILSLAIPGAGQIYNKKYWKAPIAMGGVGLMIYFISFNSERYRFYRQQYIYRVDGDPLTIDNFEQFGWGADDIRQRRDYFHKNLELSYIGILIVQILGGVDAFVDAHLMNFDVSDDLTMRISPKVDFGPFEGGSLGIGLSLHLKPPQQSVPKDFLGMK